MPELPEVETTRRGIEPWLMQQCIDKVLIRQPKLRWPIPSQLKKQAAGQRILAVDRRAKYLVLKLENGTILMHLGMSGKLCILQDKAKPKKHDHVDIILKNGTILRYNDPRRFGAILWTTQDPLQHPLLSRLGPEPLSNEFSAQTLYLSGKKRKTAVKSFIMDSKIVVGVGNIYAAEALFASRIHPQQPIQTLSFEQCQLLVKHIKKILRKAIKLGGTTLKDFTQADGKPGYFQQSLQVYGRANEECTTCSTILQNVIVAQRSSVFCPQCQAIDLDS